MKEKKYLIYNNDGSFYSFCIEMSPDDITSTHTDLNYIEITDNIYEFINNQTELNKLVINKELLLSDSVNVLNNEKYITIVTSDNEIAILIDKMIKELKSECGKMIDAGKYIALSDECDDLFTYKLEDQLNLQSIVNRISNNASKTYYYRASGSNYKTYSKEDIIKIYHELEDYKNYNLIYTDVLCEWIANNYTLEDYNNNIIISYGFSNDEILMKVGDIYGN